MNDPHLMIGPFSQKILAGLPLRPDPMPRPLMCRIAALLDELKEQEAIFKSQGNDEAEMAVSVCRIRLHEVVSEFAGEMKAFQQRRAPKKPEPSGTQEDYERDLIQAQAAYKANPSGMNLHDLSDAKSALQRHFPNSNLAR